MNIWKEYVTKKTLNGTSHVSITRHEYLERISRKKVKFRQDYAKRLLSEFATETQSHNFVGDNYLFIEGVIL